MNNAASSCVRCGSDLTEAIATGTAFCPKCGASLSAELHYPPNSVKAPIAASWGSKVLFWILLLAPALVALICFSLGQASKDLRDGAVAISLGNFWFAAACSIYCGIWLALRFARTVSVRILVGLAVVAALIAVNFIIIFAGCAANIRIN